MPRRLLIDGYNLMYAYPESQALAGTDLETAREQLLRALVEYGARNDYRIEVVFDAHGATGAARSEQRTPFLKVTFTGSGRSADAYIEGVAARLKGREDFAVVVTGDYHQQKVVGGAGLLRVSPREFIEEMQESKSGGSDDTPRKAPRRVRVADRLDPETRRQLEEIRLRKRSKQ